MVEDRYDLAALSEQVVALKRAHPDSNDASVRPEPDSEYDHLIQVRDVLRSAQIHGSAEEEPMRLALFTDVAIGDAP